LLCTSGQLREFRAHKQLSQAEQMLGTPFAHTDALKHTRLTVAHLEELLANDDPPDTPARLTGLSSPVPLAQALHTHTTDQPQRASTTVNRPDHGRDR
jgi:hypothetical protein